MIRPTHPAALPAPPRRNLPHTVGRALLVAGLLAALLGGCRGGEGDPGGLRAYFQRTPDVTAADVASLGVASPSGFPDETTDQALTATTGVVTWTSNGVSYLSAVTLKLPPGADGKAGLLPANNLVGLPPLIAKRGGTGATQKLVFLFRENRLYVFDYAAPVAGDPVP